MKQPTVIAPSILSADFARLGQDVEDVLAAGADWVHFDVMDNHYVPNLTIGPLVCEALRKHGVTAPIDVHLMVQPVDDLVEDPWRVLPCPADGSGCPRLAAAGGAIDLPRQMLAKEPVVAQAGELVAVHAR